MPLSRASPTARMRWGSRKRRHPMPACRQHAWPSSSSSAEQALVIIFLDEEPESVEPAEAVVGEWMQGPGLSSLWCTCVRFHKREDRSWALGLLTVFPSDLAARTEHAGWLQREAFRCHQSLDMCKLRTLLQMWTRCFLRSWDVGASHQSHIQKLLLPSCPMPTNLINKSETLLPG
jgi:hypothetical protein